MRRPFHLIPVEREARVDLQEVIFHLDGEAGLLVRLAHRTVEERLLGMDAAGRNPERAVRVAGLADDRGLTCSHNQKTDVVSPASLSMPLYFTKLFFGEGDVPSLHDRFTELED